MQLTEPLEVLVVNAAQVAHGRGAEAQFFAFQIAQRLIDRQARQRARGRLVCALFGRIAIVEFGRLAGVGHHPDRFRCSIGLRHCERVDAFRFGGKTGIWLSRVGV